MSKKLEKSYRFAGFSAGYISIILTIILGSFFYFQGAINVTYLILNFIVCFITCFLMIQLRIEKLIYRRIKEIYDEVTLLDASSLSQQQVSTDMKTLTKQIGRFAENKKLEIETLKIRENYRKEFIGNVSHELKTPLFTVQGYILTLLDGAMKDKSVRKKYLKRANKGVERLIYIVKDLDMISKLEVGGLQLQKERFNIIKLIQNVFDLLEMKAAKKKINLIFDIDYKSTGPIEVYADQERIQQVVTNLIVNSIKYGKNNGSIEVSVEDLIKNKVIVRVTDNGEGIEAQHINRVFERFYRVDKSGSRKEGGSGLGLSIVKHILEAHSEKIYVESQYGVGSEFSFTMEKAK
ncbi:two-component sensor histidine kinase [Patiriisocius marinistellae]|uniref:histidine kinase n=1 Tax=Patiriisocius marinistellae TaxID=2494560 RepID=A0A5J4FWT6_9FLAO|nr:ATP-binding protein [Patiriisocius marinistellae]GEQ84566.1 two-component sensor histidine kinase [Patiriisocius marinistellae]